MSPWFCDWVDGQPHLKKGSAFRLCVCNFLSIEGDVSRVIACQTITILEFTPGLAFQWNQYFKLKNWDTEYAILHIREWIGCCKYGIRWSQKTWKHTTWVVTHTHKSPSQI